MSTSVKTRDSKVNKKEKKTKNVVVNHNTGSGVMHTGRGNIEQTITSVETTSVKQGKGSHCFNNTGATIKEQTITNTRYYSSSSDSDSDSSSSYEEVIEVRRVKKNKPKKN